jgi:hypothetical protein
LDTQGAEGSLGAPDAFAGNVMPELQLIERIAYPCKVTNEDLFDCNGQAAWIFDGASGIGPGVIPGAPSDPYWLVQAMNAAIKAHWRDEAPTKALLMSAAQQVIAQFAHAVTNPAPPLIDRPTACWLMARLWDGGLELSTVGDCQLIHSGARGVFHFGGDLGDVAAPVRQALAQLKQARVAAEDLVQRLLPLEREVRAKANIEGGYAIVDLTTRWIDRIEQKRVSISAGDRILLMTDGLYRLIDTFNRYSAETLIAAALRDGLQPLYDELRALEADDETCEAFPRAKVRDDVAAALLRIA